MQRSLRHEGQFVLVFHQAQRLDERSGNRGKKAALQLRRQFGSKSGELGNCGVGGIESGELGAGLCCHPLHRGDGRPGR